MKPRKCNECKAELEKGERMRVHWRELHAEKYARILEWLGEVDMKLEYAKVVAAAGMQGPGSSEGGIVRWSKIEAAARIEDSDRAERVSKRSSAKRVDSFSAIHSLCS